MNRAEFVDTSTRAGTRVVRDTLMVIGPPLRQLLKDGHCKGCTRCKVGQKVGKTVEKVVEKGRRK